MSNAANAEASTSQRPQAGQEGADGSKKRAVPAWMLQHVARKKAGALKKNKAQHLIDLNLKAVQQSAQANGVEQQAANKNKAKSNPVRLRTPTPPPAVEEAIQFETVRLNIQLQSLENDTRTYFYSIKQLLNAQHEPEAENTRTEIAENGQGTEQLGEHSTTTLSPLKTAMKKRKRQTKATFEQYDLDDPFLDDSELLVDEPLTYGKAKESGFFVSAGDVELATIERPERKSRILSTNVPLTAPNGMVMLPQVMQCLGPIAGALLGTTIVKKAMKKDHEADQNDAESGEDVSAYVQQRKADQIFADFADPTKQEMIRLRESVQKTDFGAKKEFPPTLKPQVIQAAQVAMQNGDYGETFFAVLPKFFPFNGFTMRRFCKRECYDLHIAALESHLQRLQTELKQAIALTSEAQVTAWETQQQNQSEKQQEQVDKVSEILPTPTAEEAEATMDAEGEQTEHPETKAGGAGAGGKRVVTGPIWRWTPEQRSLFLACVKIVDEMCELSIERHALKKQDPKSAPTQKQQRSTLYTFIVSLFPLGFMTNEKLSRVVAVDKKRTEHVV